MINILIILIFINSIGYHTYNQIKKEDTVKLESNDRVKITTLDEKSISFTMSRFRDQYLKDVYSNIYLHFYDNTRIFF